MGITLIAPVGQRGEDASRFRRPAGLTIRPCARADTDALGPLYFTAYEPGEARAYLAASVADIAASFNGEYGDLWSAASPVAMERDVIVGTLLTVRRAAWEPAPPCPYIIELFTARTHRRRGIARALLAACSATLLADGEDAVALSVEPSSVAARHLYDAAGFTPSADTFGLG